MDVAAAASAASAVCAPYAKTVHFCNEVVGGTGTATATSPDWCIALLPPVEEASQWVPLLAAFVSSQLTRQQFGSSMLIQLQHLDAPEMPEMVYVLSTLFDKIHVVNPAPPTGTHDTPSMAHTASTSSHCYLVCERLCAANTARNTILRDLGIWAREGAAQGTCTYTSLLSAPISRYFSNKWDELCAILGQQYLEAIDQWVAFCRHKKNSDHPPPPHHHLHSLPPVTTPPRLCHLHEGGGAAVVGAIG